jgi:hypothetical protein
MANYTLMKLRLRVPQLSGGGLRVELNELPRAFFSSNDNHSLPY